ncbi:rCG49154, partial [Rattus norvegicus]
MSTPPDLSQENFRIFSSVEKTKLPSSQLGLVISSFYQTIDVLQASNQRSLKVQTLHSLGSLLIFADKKRAAFKCWSQALDDIFRKPDVLHNWKEFGNSLPSATSSSSPPGFKDYSEEFLSKFGIWGCLQGAVISAKIAQFIKTTNVKERINCCILSALLFQSLLRTTLPHPKAERSYAQYEITQLLPGIELFSDKFRADICIVVASLYYVIRELHYAKYNLIITQSFDSGKPLTSKDNMQALEELVNRGLPSVLVNLGSQHLLNKFNFVKSHFFISLAATVNCIPDNSPKIVYYPVIIDKSKPNTQNAKDNENSHAQLLRFRDDYTLNTIKSILLMEAEDKINSLLSETERQCNRPLYLSSVADLEIMVEARLHLAAIALQRFRPAYSTAIIYCTLKLLQDSKVFKKRLPEEPCSPTSPETSTTENKDDGEFLDPVSLNCREYFNIHLWLRCRLMLVTSFVAQIRGIGIMK